MSSEFPNDVTHSVISHMNEDHADALAVIAEAFGELETGETWVKSPMSSARITDFNAREMTIAVTHSEGQDSVHVRFSPPIDSVDNIRLRLVELTRQARAANLR